MARVKTKVTTKRRLQYKHTLRLHEVRNIRNKLERARYIHDHLNFTVTELIQLEAVPKSAWYRMMRALKHNRNPGQTGRSRLLTMTEEKMAINEVALRSKEYSPISARELINIVYHRF